MTNKSNGSWTDNKIDNLWKIIKQLQLENECLKEEIDLLEKDQVDMYPKESVKYVINEFVEKIKEQECVEDFSIHGDKIVYVEDIDKIKQDIFDKYVLEGD